MTKNRLLPDLYGNSSEYQEARALAFRARLNDYTRWLVDNGAVLEPLADTHYEVLRYKAWDATQPGKARRPMTHVIYQKNDGRITFTGKSGTHWSLYVARQPFPDQSRSKENAKAVSRVRHKELSPGERPPSWSKKTRDILRARDGDLCWFCGRPCPEDKEPGVTRRQWFDIRPTIEHLLAKHLGGTNHIDNLVLAHARCNRDVGHRTVDEKHKVRELIIAGLKSSVAHWIDPPPRKQRVATK